MDEERNKTSLLYKNMAKYAGQIMEVMPTPFSSKIHQFLTKNGAPNCFISDRLRLQYQSSFPEKLMSGIDVTVLFFQSSYFPLNVSFRFCLYGCRLTSHLLIVRDGERSRKYRQEGTTMTAMEIRILFNISKFKPYSVWECVDSKGF